MRAIILIAFTFTALLNGFAQDTSITYDGNKRVKTTFVKISDEPWKADFFYHHENNAPGVVHKQRGHSSKSFYTKYYNNGQIFHIGANGQTKRKGISTYYYPNGQIMISGKYKINKNTERKGYKDSKPYGPWKFYKPDGSILETVKFKSDWQNECYPYLQLIYDFKKEETKKLYELTKLKLDQIPIQGNFPFEVEYDQTKYKSTSENSSFNRYTFVGLIDQSILRYRKNEVDTIKVEIGKDYISLGQNHIIEINPQHLIVYGFNGKFDYGFQLLETKDGGKTWHYLDFPNEMDDPVQWSPLKFHDQTKLSLEFSKEKQEITIFNDRYTASSSDGGKTWTEIKEVK